MSTLGLVAHDNRKPTLLRWVREHRNQLDGWDVCATCTTGALIEQELGRPVTKYLSGPLGGDLQIGARAAEQQLDLLIFFWDPLAAQPHDPEVKALLRIAVLWNIPIAMNEASADLILRGLAQASYQRRVPDHTHYRAIWNPA